MVGQFDVAHCFPCGSCVIICPITDKTNVNFECAAGWEYDSELGTWSTNTPGAFNHTILGTPDTTTPFNVRVVFTVAWAINGQSLTFNLTGGQLDCDNYWRARLILNKVGSNNTAKIELDIVEAGVVTATYATHPFTGMSQNAAAAFNTTQTYQLSMCFTGSKLTATSDAFAGDDVTIQVNGITSALGTLAGFHYDNGVNHSGVTINSFFLERSSVGDCKVCELSCCFGLAPVEMLVEIDGDYDEEVGGGGGYSCTIFCQKIIGTYTLPTTGDGSCSWSKIFTLTDNADCATGGITTTRHIRVELTILSTTLDSLRTILISVIWTDPAGFGGEVLLARFRKLLDMTPCMDMEDWIDIPIITTLPQGQCTDTFGGTTDFTCRIKRAA